jgi:hypothetical protein
VRWTELAPGQEVTGRVAGAVHDEFSDRAHLLVEGTDGLLHVIRQTPAMERRRGEGGLRTGSVVTLTAREVSEGDRRGTDLQIQDHGRLEGMRGASEPTTILDRELITAVRVPGPGRIHGGSSRFSRAWGAALQERADLLLRAGLLEENESSRPCPRASMWVPSPWTMVNAIPRREVGSTLRQTRRASASRAKLRDLAVDEEGRRVAVLDLGRHLAAVPTDEIDLQVRREYHAEAVSRRYPGGERVQVLAWRFEDVERPQERSRSRQDLFRRQTCRRNDTGP